MTLYNTHLRFAISFFLISAFISVPLIQTSHAHQIALYTIKDKYHLFEVEWANEPVAVDDKTNVQLTAFFPNATDPINPEAIGTQPITGLENSLKVEISAGDKNMTSDLEPAFGELGSYESKTFYPTIETTYSFRIFGDINGTSFDQTFACNPTLGENSPPDNSTVQISQDVVRKALIGGLECPEPRLGFPEPYVSQSDINQALNKTTTSKQ
jgi:hypothetical protein